MYTRNTWGKGCKIEDHSKDGKPRVVGGTKVKVKSQSVRQRCGVTSAHTGPFRVVIRHGHTGTIVHHISVKLVAIPTFGVLTTRVAVAEREFQLSLDSLFADLFGSWIFSCIRYSSQFKDRKPWMQNVPYERLPYYFPGNYSKLNILHSSISLLSGYVCCKERHCLMLMHYIYLIAYTNTVFDQSVLRNI